MYFDYTYLVLVLPAIILAMIASSRVHTVFRHYEQQHSRRGLTGAAAARAVLDANGLHQVQIEHISGKLTDHYDPRDNVIRLSDSVYNSTSTAAIGVAAMKQATQSNMRSAMVHPTGRIAHHQSNQPAPLSGIL